MDPVVIGLAATSGALLLLLLTVWLVGRRRARRLRRSAEVARADASLATDAARERDEEAKRAAAGEREGAWASRAAMRRAGVQAERAVRAELRAADADQRVSAAEAAAQEAHRAVDQAERQIDELREALSRAESELTAALRQGEADRDRIATLETEVAAGNRMLEETRTRLQEAQTTIERLNDEVASRPEPSPPQVSPTPDPEVIARLRAALLDAQLLRERVDALETALAASAKPAEPDEQLPPDPWNIDEHRRLLAARDDRIASLERDLEQSLAETRSARASVEALRQQLSILEEHPPPQVEQEQASVPPAFPPRDEELERLRSRLTAREAELREMQTRLDAVAAARSSEVRRLNDRIAAMEHLYTEVEGKDERISSLQSDLKEHAELLEAARNEARALETEIATLRSDLGEARAQTGRLERATGEVQALQNRSAPADTAELDRLRKALAAERERGARLAARAGRSDTGDVTTAVTAAIAPLRDRLERLEAALARPPAPAAARPPGTEVTRIKGIGPVIAGILAEHGITTVRQVADLTPSRIEQIRTDIPVFGGRIERDRWVEQAREIVASETA